ncbi:CocE/NonD family hydrolase [Halomarina litorea]|uniref:CocE/NonD family hydrolase n=1 Tax=Halomarina litorea TaxID=2961595 RepID=UPI0020C2E621|nr:CocE/NonD family hydrolase [Halomarina sp. BCD28]
MTHERRDDDGPGGVGRRGVLRGLALAALAGAGTESVRAAANDGAGYDQRPVSIDSFDGTTLAGSLYEPTGPGPFPAMLMTHGWGGDHTSERVRRLADLYASNGYVVLAYDSRGFGESGGGVGVDGPNEVGDARALVSWLAEYDSVANDGPDDPKVGMDNVSYAGGIQLNTAAVDDRIDAIVPRWAWNDLPYALAPNGVIKAGWDTLLFATGVTGARGVTSGDGYPQEEDILNGLDLEVYEANLLGSATNEFPEESTEYYRARSPSTKLDGVDTPTLVISGWPDTLFVPNEALWNYGGLRERGVETRLVLFEGGHTLTDAAGSDQRSVLDDAALAWVDEHVAGRGPADLPPVTFYEVQSGEWRTTSDVPPGNAGAETFDLADAGSGVSLGDSTLVANSVAPTSTSQLSLENGDHVPGTAADFDFTLDSETEVFGAPALSLTLDAVGTEAHLYAKVYRVVDGEATLIDNQVTPLRFDGPGRHEVDVEMTAFQRRFAAGETLRVTLATTDGGFYNSRECAGVNVRHAPGESTVTFPVVGATGDPPDVPGMTPETPGGRPSG